jgi:hypothetical protein
LAEKEKPQLIRAGSERAAAEKTFTSKDGRQHMRENTEKPSRTRARESAHERSQSSSAEKRDLIGNW